MELEIIEGVDEPLVLPIRVASGEVKKYSVKPCSAGNFVVLSLLKMRNAQIQLMPEDISFIGAFLDDTSFLGVWRLALGDALDEMIKDGVPQPIMRLAAATASDWQAGGQDFLAAESRWSGKASSTASQTPKGSLGEEVVATRTASGSGTSTRKSSKQSSSGRAQAGAGQTSGKSATSSKPTSPRPIPSISTANSAPTPGDGSE